LDSFSLITLGNFNVFHNSSESIRPNVSFYLNNLLTFPNLPFYKNKFDYGIPMIGDIELY